MKTRGSNNMGRSKFPGKPPKTVTRKRIKVLAGCPQTAQSHTTVTVAENIYYGVSVVSDNIDDNEKEHSPFHGFSSNEAKLSVSYVKTKQHDADGKIRDDFTNNIRKETVNDIKSLSSDTNELNEHDEAEKISKQSTSAEDSSVQTRYENKKQLNELNKTKVNKSVKFKRIIRAPILKSVNNILDRHQRTRQLRNSTAKRLLQRAKFNVKSNNRNVTISTSDKSNSVKKFVLPMRSAHSSRVIKPNKRFIEELEETRGNESVENEVCKISKKPKTVMGKRIRMENDISDILSSRNNKKIDMKKKTKKNSQRRTMQSQSTISSLMDIENHAMEVTQKDCKERRKNLWSKVESMDRTMCNIDIPLEKTDTDLSLQDGPISVPPKVLPTVNVLIIESSRIQTRSKLLNHNIVNGSEQINNENRGDSTKHDNDVNRQAYSITNDENAEDMMIVNIQKVNSRNNHDVADSSLSESGSDQSNHSEDEQSEWTGMGLNGGKVILRKARLKLENKNSGGPEGPFSVTNTTNNTTGSINSGMTGTVKCGVCGAVRFYRFVKQARKFGIYSCESCRKFISKIIKRQACAKSANNSLPIIQCMKGDGMCLVPPVVRSQQWNLMRCVYKTRCHACWLKMCLKCYNITSNVKAELNALLPTSMRDPVISLGSLNQDDLELLGKKNTVPIISWPAEDNMETNLFKSAMSLSGIDIGKKLGYQSNVQGCLSKKINKFDYPISMSLSKKRKKDTRIKVRKKMKNCIVISPVASSSPSKLPLSSSSQSQLSTSSLSAPLLTPPLSSSISLSSSPSSSVTTNQSSQTVRQRIDVKGPRVKHVCRSASVALGQPIATFPNVEEKEEPDNINKNISKCMKDERIQCKIIDETTKGQQLHMSGQEDNEDTCNSLNQHFSLRKKSKAQQNNLASNSQTIRSLSTAVTNSSHEISIDFWEQYDPAEVGATGFALIASENLHILAICFLCGSAGKEPLIFCQCCCEPYHSFCLEPSEWNVCVESNWYCPRCTTCQTCNLKIGPKLSCIRCRQSFHHSCLSKSGINARLYSPDRPYICQSCVRCKSCGSEGVNVYVGNLPLCSMCFKLRQRGNYCPICQRCYNENDFDTKMMECNECSCWIHARCEGLSDEYYQVLSSLPDFIEFNCSQCSPNRNSSWRNAIENELNAGFIAVIKALSKNRKICAALKWSPRKECPCKVGTGVKKSDIIDGKLHREMADEMEEISNETIEFDTTGNMKTERLVRSDFDINGSSNDVRKRGIRKLKRKFHLKECSVRVKKCISKNDQYDDISSQESSTSSSDYSSSQCPEQQTFTRPSPTLMSVKQKVSNNQYRSLLQFHCDMEHVVHRVGVADLVETYHKSLQEIFPWFDPKRSTINLGNSEVSTSIKSLGDEPDSSMKKLDDSIMEKWKEGVLTASKAITGKTSSLYNNSCVEDNRCCALCKGVGNGEETIEGRLLYCGRNEWIHVNCALWSNEVFEEIDGSLQNVHSAISRGRLIRCSDCGKKGATVGCCAKNCSNTYHFFCAKNIGLRFIEDKTIFCLSHLSNCVDKNAHNEDEFRVKRSIYVELDRKKKKYAESSQIKVMIGSLMIECLGTVIPEFSDSHDKIIPVNYKCSRLYWSTVDPMKIVKYYIRSYVQTYSQETVEDLEHNITIDHSREEENEECRKLDQLIVKQTVDTLIDSVHNREVDENLSEQNNTDLLPPDITDVIFEDLPHDLLDGISMQDIFPKMSYEDFLAMDFRNDGVFGTDLLKDEILTSDVDEIIKLSDSKASKLDPMIPEFGVHNDLWLHLETKGCVQELMDDILSSKNQKVGGKELRRSKSEVMSNHSITIGSQKHHQRSCSLTWSCKLDGTYGPTMKRRKLPSRPTTSTKVTDTNIMLHDAHNDKASMLHELRIPESIMLTVGRTNTPSILSDSVKELKYCIDDSTVINRRTLSSREDTKDHKRLLWPTRQQSRMLQVDGSIDSISVSECSSPEYNIEQRIPQIDGAYDEFFRDNSNRFTYIKQLDPFTSNNNIKTHQTTMENIKRNIPSVEHYKSCSIFKIPQFDGADDVSSDDENPHDVNADTLNYSTTVDLNHSPVTCKRCQCTYRTYDSYDRHLINCDIITTSDSDSETIDNKGASPESRFSNSIMSVSPQFVTISPSDVHTLTRYSDMQVTSPLKATIPSSNPTIQIEPITQAMITPQIHTHATVETVHQTVLTTNDVIVQTQYTRTTTTLPNSTTVLPADNTNIHIDEIADTPLSTGTNITTNLTLSRDKNCQSTSSPQSSPTISTTAYTHVGCVDDGRTDHHFAKISKPKSPRTSKSKVKMIKPQTVRPCVQQQMEPIRYHTVQNTAPVQIQLQQQSRSGAPAVIIQQVQPQELMSAYVETLQQQSGQNLQYITAIGGQNSGYKPQFIATNQLVPSTFIQTASDNLLALPNGGISVLPSVQITQPQPTVLGTIIQPQPSAIQCGVISSEQLVLSTSPTLEMFTDSTGSMFVSSQPMYYGLETIVSNTVMSSSQFMTGAVPQVLASSYQTTTQVFQASKLMEPIVDVQTVPNIPTIPAVQSITNVANISAVKSIPSVHTIQNIPRASSVQPVQTIPSVQAVEAIQAVRAVPNVSNIRSGYVVMNSATPPDVIATPHTSITTSPNSLPVSHEQPSFGAHISTQYTALEPAINSIQPMSQHSPIRPLSQCIDVNMGILSSSRADNSPSTSIPRVAVRPNPVSYTIKQSGYDQLKHPDYPYGVEQSVSGSTVPYLDSKHVSENTSMIKSNLTSKISPLSNHYVTQKDDVDKFNTDMGNVYGGFNLQTALAECSSISQNSAAINHGQNKPSTFIAPTTRPMNRVLPMQAVIPKQDTIKSEIKVESPTKPGIEVTQGELIQENVKTLKRDEPNKIGFMSDEIYSVDESLDMKSQFLIENKEFSDETIMLEEISTGEKKILAVENLDNGDKNICDKKIIVKENIPAIEQKMCESIQLNCHKIGEAKENLKFDYHNEKLQNSSLKIVLQKQLEDGTYKITHSMKTKNAPKITSVEILPPNQTPHIASLQLLPIKSFTVKSRGIEEKSRVIDKDVNFSKPKSPPVAVKQPRFLAKSNKQRIVDSPNVTINGKPEPRLMYEIKSQDGFSHTASSMSEIWDSVFRAVQTARQCHNLPLLAHNPLNENLGLDNNASVYLIEQLAGVDRCTKYKSKFHNVTSSKILDSDIISSTVSGAARAEPFRGRKVHDMFSWLASRHRQQPKIIPIPETEMRRAACTNLPMAMRFRMLKETSRITVGVYHSHIHGRGLFCLRDIEAGEMVIEYAGEVIRASLTDKREKYYDSKHIGCYMFKIDDHFVVDATMKGNAARFINHSCEPNCYSKVVDILGKKHILIFALRRIVQGEELTYDYKFPFEDIKIPCTCGSRKCRKYLN